MNYEKTFEHQDTSNGCRNTHLTPLDCQSCPKAASTEEITVSTSGSLQPSRPLSPDELVAYRLQVPTKTNHWITVALDLGQNLIDKLEPPASWDLDHHIYGYHIALEQLVTQARQIHVHFTVPTDQNPDDLLFRLLPIDLVQTYQKELDRTMETIRLEKTRMSVILKLLGPLSPIPNQTNRDFINQHRQVSYKTNRPTRNKLPQTATQVEPTK